MSVTPISVLSSNAIIAYRYFEFNSSIDITAPPSHWVPVTDSTLPRGSGPRLKYALVLPSIPPVLEVLRKATASARLMVINLNKKYLYRD